MASDSFLFCKIPFEMKLSQLKTFSKLVFIVSTKKAAVGTCDRRLINLAVMYFLVTFATFKTLEFYEDIYVIDD